MIIKIRNLRGESVTAKEIVDQYNFSKERIESLERKKQRILDEPPIKVTDYSEFGYGNGGGIEDKYCDRVKEINDIDEEIRWLKQYVERVEKVFSWISKTHKQELDIMLYKYTHNKNNKAVADFFGYSERTIERKLKVVCEKLVSVVN